MHISRRGFLRMGGVIGLAAIVPGQAASIAFGQRRQQDLGEGMGFSVPPRVLSDPLYSLTSPMFERCLSTDFAFLLHKQKVADLELIKVIDTTPPYASVDHDSARDAFALVFKGPDSPELKQGTYHVEHPELGKFKLFIVPGQTTLYSRNYEANINRLYP